MIYEFHGRRPCISKDAYVSEHAVVIGEVTVAAGCYVGPGAILRGDYGSIQIDEGTAVEEGVIVHAAPGTLNHIGRRVTLGHGAILHGAHVGDFCVVGMGAVVSLYAEVGENTIVAEGTVVKQRQQVPSDVVAAGAPARPVRPVSEQDKAEWAKNKQMYVDLAAKYLRIGLQRVEG